MAGDMPDLNTDSFVDTIANTVGILIVLVFVSIATYGVQNIAAHFRAAAPKLDAREIVRRCLTAYAVGKMDEENWPARDRARFAGPIPCPEE